jgi:hypothetical protein
MPLNILFLAGFQDYMKKAIKLVYTVLLQVLNFLTLLPLHLLLKLFGLREGDIGIPLIIRQQMR